MAFQTRGRDPLLDSSMAQAIEKRGQELLGIVLLCIAAIAGAMAFSYHPDDPSWMSATDAPVHNWMGQVGASVSATVFMVIGWAAAGISILLAIWGMRFMLHDGADRALSRLIFTPIWLAILSLYASSLTPGPVWSAAHSYGLGGLFGDTVLAALLGILPFGTAFGLKVLSLLLGVAALASGLFVFGTTRSDVSRTLKYGLFALIMTYAGIRAILGRGAKGAAHASVGLTASVQNQIKKKRTERREAAAFNDDPAPGAIVEEPPLKRRMARVVVDEPAEAELAPQPFVKEKTGLLARMPSLIRRPDPEPDPELITDAYEGDEPDAPAPDRVRAKIADAIRARLPQSEPIAPPVPEDKPLTKGRGRGPAPLLLNTEHYLPPEPPLTAGHVQEPTAVAHDWDAEAPLVEEDFEEIPEVPAAYSEARIPVAEPRKVVQHPPRKTPQPSTRAKEEAQPALQFEDRPKLAYELPELSLLTNPMKIERHHLSDEALEENARMLENVLDDYGVKGEIVSVRPGPVVTMYELEPAPGLKASRVIGLADDIARSMSALSARVSTVPGRSVIGIELPNDNREMVVLRELLAARDFGDSNMRLPLALGKDIGGDPVVSNLAKMPHLLIAGTTGSGKSVAINTMILSLLYKLTPEDCRLIMIDPKMLELSVYDGIPHLLSPVVTDPKKAVVALKWVVAEMEERYRKMSKMGVRNIDGYNSRVADAQAKGEMFSRTVQTGFDDQTGEPVFETDEFAPEKMPYIVVIVDEMADLMMVAGKEIEACIQRLAQMARASGIHLIMATQRPSVDVITGTIKANFPTRISFQVTSKVDSRTILGEMGAEQLLGMGDMLYMAGGGKITRCHGPFVSDEEVEVVVNHLKAYGPPDYVSGVQDGPAEEKANNIDAVLGLGGNTDGEDALYDQAVQIAITDRKCSTSYIQRKLAIGYNKAARLVEQMEDEGVVSAANHVGKREILVPEQ